LVTHTPSQEQSDRQKQEYGFHAQYIITCAEHRQIALRYIRTGGGGRLGSICEKPFFASGKKLFLNGRKPPPELLKRVGLESDLD
jgi:hypothetical protein